MAITYDYGYNIVGNAAGVVVNTASTSVSLTGLTTGEDYEVRVYVRDDQSGVVYLSAAGTATFTASAQAVTVDLASVTNSVALHSVTPILPIVVQLDALAPTSTVNAVAPVVVFTGNTYTLKLNHIEGTTTYITGLTSLSYDLTGLVENDNYEVSIQTTERVGGVEYIHPYSATAAFSPSVPSWISLDAITGNVTLNTVEPFIDPTVRVELAPVSGVVTLNEMTAFTTAIEPIAIDLTSISVTPTLNTLTAYTPEPLVVNLGSIPLAPAIKSMGAYQAGSAIYRLKLIQDGGPTVFFEDITGTNYALTGLVESGTYTVSVQAQDNVVSHEGVTYFLPYAEGLTFLSESRPDVVVNLPTLSLASTVSPLTVFDRVLQIINFDYTNDAPDFIVTGEGLPSIQSMTITVDGVPMDVVLDGTLFTGTLSKVPLLIAHIEELDGYQTLSAGNTILEVN